jgi:plastocyanin
MRRAALNVWSVVFAVALGIATLGAPVRASGVGTPIIAGPGAFVVGFATPVAAVQVGGILPFISADAQPHNVCIQGTSLCSGTISVAGVATVPGEAVVPGVVEKALPTDSLVAGNSYGFFCAIHPTMRGTLQVLPGV